MTTKVSAQESRTTGLPYHRFLPRLYRLLLTASKRHGLFTLARFHAKYFGGEQRVVIPSGASLIIPDDSHYFGFLAGVHEPHVMEIIRTGLRIGDVCIDVGANIGYFSMMMAKAVGSTGRVIAFEPVPDTFDVLKMNASLAAGQGLNIDARRAAISSQEGELAIDRREHSTLNQVRALSGDVPDGENVVSCFTLTQVLEDLGLTGRLGLLKVDVEGHELSVLQGGLPVLMAGRVSQMIIEVTPGEDAVEIERILRSCHASFRSWIDGSWREGSLGTLANRTDVLATFARTSITHSSHN